MIASVLNNQQLFSSVQQGDQFPTESFFQKEQGSLQKFRAAAAQLRPVLHQAIGTVLPHTVIARSRVSFGDILVAVGRRHKRHMAKQASQHIIEGKSVVHTVVDV